MATAFARVAGISISASGNQQLQLEVAFSGLGVAGVDILPVTVDLLPTDQPATIRSKMSAAVSAFALTLGYAVLGGDMTLPTFQKG